MCVCERTRSLGIQKLQKAHYIKGCTRKTPLLLSQLCNDVKSYYLFEECITIYNFLFALSLLLLNNIFDNKIILLFSAKSMIELSICTKHVSAYM